MSDAKTILVVEDEADLIKLVEKKLIDHGFNVVKAMTGEEAVSKFDGNKIDLVLMDVVLPDTDGFAICKKIKEELSPSTLVLVYTGKLEKVDVVMARESHADEMVVKSGNLDSTIQKVEELLGS